MKETFIAPLLHPFSASTQPSLPEYDEYLHPDSPSDSMDPLPIAARFMSPLGFRTDTPTSPTSTSRAGGKDTPNIDGESMDTDDEETVGKMYGQGNSATAREAAKHDHPLSPYRAAASKFNGKSFPFPSRSHHSLPPPVRGNFNTSTQSLGRQSNVNDRDRKQSQDTPPLPDRNATPTPSSRVLRKFRKSTTGPDSLVVPGAIPPHQLPEDLRICLDVIENKILDGHARLSEGLRKRYEDQYPLIRSLADVFVTNVCFRSSVSTEIFLLTICRSVSSLSRICYICPPPGEGARSGRKREQVRCEQEDEEAG